MNCTVADCVERVLFERGIQHLAMLPGGPLMPLLQSIHAQGRIRPILTRHESGAAMLAEGYYRVSHRPAALALTAGPGVSNAATGIALAFSEQTPMVVISAQIATHWYGRGAAQELDTVRLLEPITKASVPLLDPERTQPTLEHLVRIATSGRGGPVHLSVPSNFWTRSCRCEAALDRCSTQALGSGVSTESAEALAAQITAARAPCVLVGRGVVLAQAEPLLLALSARFEHLRFACSPRAKGAFPEDHEKSLGVFGFAGHARATEALLENSDLLVILGSRLGEITSLGWDPRFRSRKLAQVDIEPSELGKNFPVELGIAADVHALLTRLLKQPAASDAAGHLASALPLNHAVAEAPVRDVVSLPVRDTLAASSSAGVGLCPSRVMAVLNRTLGGDEHVFIDIGNCMAWALHYLERNRPGRWHVNLMFGCMGHSLPAAIGGALGASERVVVITGDAAFAMSAFELHTAVETGVPIVIIVLNDSGHGMVEMGSEWQFGPNAVPDARFQQRIDAAAMARAVGASGASAITEQELEVAVVNALERRRAGLVDVRIDPTKVPPFGARMDLLKKNFGQSDNGDAQ